VLLLVDRSCLSGVYLRLLKIFVGACYIIIIQTPENLDVSVAEPKCGRTDLASARIGYARLNK
jgi:hypothetical protein